MNNGVKTMRSEGTLPPDVLGSNEVCELLGVSSRMLQWWDETGLVKPRKKGYRRHYTEADLTRIGLVKALREKGVSIQQARTLLKGSGLTGWESSTYVVLTERQPHSVNRKHKVALFSGPDAQKLALDFLCDATRPVLAVNIRAIRELVAECLPEVAA